MIEILIGIYCVIGFVGFVFIMLACEENRTFVNIMWAIFISTIWIVFVPVLIFCAIEETLTGWDY